MTIFNRKMDNGNFDTIHAILRSHNLAQSLFEGRNAQILRSRNRGVKRLVESVTECFWTSVWRALCSCTSTQQGHSLIDWRLYSGPQPLTKEMRNMHNLRKSSTPTVHWKPGCMPTWPPCPSVIARAWYWRYVNLGVRARTSDYTVEFV